jgi:hypothetical protein
MPHLARKIGPLLLAFLLGVVADPFVYYQD